MVRLLGQKGVISISNSFYVVFGPSLAPIRIIVCNEYSVADKNLSNNEHIENDNNGNDNGDNGAISDLKANKCRMEGQMDGGSDGSTDGETLT